MNGLDRILAEIAQDAKTAAEQKRSDANAAAQRTISRAREEAQTVEADAAQRAELEYKRIISRAHSTGEIAKKGVLLREKQKIIDGILKDAHVKLAGLGDEEYFAFMVRLLNKYASGEKGEVLLSKRDRARVTAEFTAAAEQKGLTISGETRDIDGGFVLSYGSIEENCSIEALMESERDRLHDVVKGFLFGQG